MTGTKGRRPAIHMIDDEADRLSDLAVQFEERAPEVSAMLLEEIGRATLHRRDAINPKIVTMNATVEFIDDASGADRTVQLVYPAQADIAAGRISIMTPVGAGLIGLREGQSIIWPDRDGHQRKLTIVKVMQAAPAA